MKIVVLAVGKLRSAALKDVCADYLARLQRYGSAEVQEVKAAEGLAPAAAVEQECTRLLDALQPGDTVWALDERGTEFTSLEFSAQLTRLEQQSVRRWVLLLGGAYGLNDAVRARAKQNGRWLALAKATLPHELCRAVVLEQLYRARTIQRGEPYHHQ